MSVLCIFALVSLPGPRNHTDTSYLTVTYNVDGTLPSAFQPQHGT